MSDRLHENLRVLYLGMRGAFSLPPLQALIAAGHDVCAVLVPGDRAERSITELRPTPSPSLLPIINPHVARSIVQLAWEHAIPVFEIGDIRAAAELIAAHKPDVAIVACWDRRIPARLLTIPRLGFVNLHPSLLPAYRGPAPLFWTLRDGLHETGVTLHRMEATLDTGPIVAQAPLTLPDSVSETHADTLLATLGGHLLIDALAAARKTGTFALKPQRGAPTYAPTPAPDDFRLDPRWSARRAFNFMRGTADWQQPYPITVGGETLQLRAAIGYRPDATLNTPFARSGSRVFVQFAPGVLEAEIG